MKVVPYTPERRQDVIDLNTWWIVRYFGRIEPDDQAEFHHIDDEVAKGGMAFFAVDDEGHALATCMAIIRSTDGTKDDWEIAKLGSDPDRPHKGCGKAVFEACVDWAIAHGAKHLYIITNSSLKPAIHIYESHGFKHVGDGSTSTFARGDYELERFV